VRRDAVPPGEEATVAARHDRYNRDGFAMATTLLMVLVLSVIAVGAAWLASTERRTSHAESVHISSVYSADAGGEAAINFLRLSENPPQIQDFTDMTVRTEGETSIQGTQNYDYECQYLAKRPKPGWGAEYLDYDYTVLSNGRASRDGRSAVQLVASRLYREGY
jgi:hypothetical protein